MEKLGNDNPTKDGSLKLVFSEFYFLQAEKVLRERRSPSRWEVLGRLQLSAQIARKGVIYLDYYTVEGGVGNHFPNYKLKKIIFIQNENFSSTYE